MSDHKPLTKRRSVLVMAIMTLRVLALPLLFGLVVSMISGVMITGFMQWRNYWAVSLVLFGLWCVVLVAHVARQFRFALAVRRSIEKHAAAENNKPSG